MPKRPIPEPYRSPTPWAGFTPRECKRATPLARCPAAACARSKHCIRACDGLYCRRTHETPAEHRARLKASARHAKTPVVKLPVLPPNPSLEQAEAYRIASDLMLAHVEERQARLTQQWKAGKLDHLYGPYDPKGALMRPPPRVYVEPSTQR